MTNAKQSPPAWYRYPEPDGKDYSLEELQSRDIATELFDYCQLGLAYISKEGWKALIEFHGLDGLYEINETSGWLAADNWIEFIDGVKYQCLISGYNPETNQFGDYAEDTGIFKTGSDELEIQWGVGWVPVMP